LPGGQCYSSLFGVASSLEICLAICRNHEARDAPSQSGGKEIVRIVSLTTNHFINRSSIKRAPILRMFALDKEYFSSAHAHNVDAAVI
jgi:hypothetical protein